MAAARRCGETGPTSRECRFLAAILPYDDVLRFRDVNNDAKSKAKEHTSHLERRLKLWLDGKLDELLYEGRTIQQRLTQRMPPQQKSDDQTARTFAKLMMEGKVHAALRLVTEGNNGGPLPLHHPVNTCDPNSTHTVYDTLLEKHPPKRPAKRSAILTQTRPPDQPHPVLFDRDRWRNRPRHHSENGWCSRPVRP